VWRLHRGRSPAPGMRRVLRAGGRSSAGALRPPPGRCHPRQSRRRRRAGGSATCGQRRELLAKLKAAGWGLEGGRGIAGEKVSALQRETSRPVRMGAPSLSAQQKRIERERQISTVSSTASGLGSVSQASLAANIATLLYRRPTKGAFRLLCRSDHTSIFRDGITDPLSIHKRFHKREFRTCL